MTSTVSLTEMAAIAAAQDTRPATPLSQFDSIFIEHPSYVRALGRIEDAIKLYGQSNEAPCLQVTGPPGIGKSTLVDKIKARHPRVKDGRSFVLSSGAVATCDHVPVLCAKMPDTPTATRLRRALLQQIGDPKWATGKHDAVRIRLPLYARACAVHAVIIDDTQRAVDRRGVIVKQELAFMLVDLHTETGVVIILLGLGRLKFFIDQDSQITRRWDGEFRIKPYEWGLEDQYPESRNDFIGILVVFWERFPLPWSSYLNLKRDMDGNRERFLWNCKRFYYASRGVIGLLTKLFRAVLRISEEQKQYKVTKNLMCDAFELAFGEEKKEQGLVNPFGPSWKGELPPPLQDDTVPLNPRANSRSRNPTKGAQRAELTHALTVS